MGPGRHPPAEVDSWTRSGRSKMRMRLPVHVWAMLSRGSEAESCVLEQAAEDERRVRGVSVRERWREFDGERCWRWRHEDGSPRTQWREWLMRRMVWVNVGSQWHGEWTWQEFDNEHWEGGIIHRWRDMGREVQPGTAPNNGGNIPQEILLWVVQSRDPRDWVSASVDLQHYAFTHLIVERPPRCWPHMPRMARDLRADTL